MVNIFDKIKEKIFGKEKIEPPDVRAYIKLTDVAKENGITTDANRIIEIHKGGKIERKEKNNYLNKTIKVLINKKI